MAGHLETIAVGVLEPSNYLGGFLSLGGPNFNGGASDPSAYPAHTETHIHTHIHTHSHTHTHTHT